MDLQEVECGGFISFHFIYQVFQVASFFQVLSPKPYIHLSCHPIRVTCSAHLNLLDLFTQVIFGEQYRSFSPSLRSLLHSPVTPSLLGPNILLNTLFSNTLSLRSSPSVSDQVSHSYKTTGKIMVLYISIFLFWGNKLEYKRFFIE